MRSFFSGLWDCFKPLPPKIRKPMPSKSMKVPPPPGTSRIVEVIVKNKETIKKLKESNKALQIQLDNQTELLTNVVKELAQLKRDVAPLLSEK